MMPCIENLSPCSYEKLEELRLLSIAFATSSVEMTNYVLFQFVRNLSFSSSNDYSTAEVQTVIDRLDWCKRLRNIVKNLIKKEWSTLALEEFQIGSMVRPYSMYMAGYSNNAALLTNYAEKNACKFYPNYSTETKKDLNGKIYGLSSSR